MLQGRMEMTFKRYLCIRLARLEISAIGNSLRYGKISFEVIRMMADFQVILLNALNILFCSSAEDCKERWA